MGVNYRTIDLPFGGGVDSKTNAQLANVPKMSQVVNMRFFESGAYSRRESYTAIAQPSGTLNRLTEYGGAPLALTSTGLFRYIEGQWRSATTPGPRPVGVRRQPIVRDDGGVNDIYSAAADGLVASVWSRQGANDADSSYVDQVWFQITDADNGALIYGPVVVANALGGGVNTADATGLDVFPLYSSGGDLYFVVICRNTATTYPSTTAYRISSRSVISATQANLTSPASMLATGSLVEVLDGDTSAYLLAYNGSVNVLCRLQISGSSCVVESSATITSLGGAGFAKGILVNDVAAKVFVYGGDVSELKTANFTYGAALTGTTAAVSLYVPGASPAPKAPILAVYGATRADGTMVLFCETSAVLPPAPPTEPTSAPCVKWFELSSAGALVASAERTIWCAQLLARPFLYDSRVFCPIVSANLISADAVSFEEADTHSTTDYWVQNAAAYLLEVSSASDTDGRRAAEFLVDVARRPGYREATGPTLGRVSRTSLVEDGSTQYLFGAPTDTVGFQSFSSSGLPARHTADNAILDMAPKPSGVAHANGAQLFAGGYVSQCDGERHAEVMQCPRPTIVRAESDVDGQTLTGTIGYRFAWAWRDRLGNLHRSAPSEPLIIDLDDAAFSTQGKGRSPYVRIAIPPFLDAASDDFTHPTDVVLEGYNSPGFSVTSGATALAVDDVYRRCAMLLYGNDLSDGPINDSSVTGIRLDELRDPLRPWMSLPIAIGYAAGELPLYTNGGVLPHDPIPHAEHIVSSRDRVWLIDSEDRYRALHSTPIRAGSAPAFSQEFFVRVPTEAGELVALGVIGDSLCLLSETSIHMLETIEGPDSTNAGAFPPLREVSREVGCINRASVVSTDVGLFFESASGIHLLDTAGGLTHIGRDIQPTLAGQTIVGADVLPDERQVRFTAAGGSVFVFDYEAAQWSTYSLASSTVDDLVSSARVNGEHVVGDASAIVYIGDGANDLGEQVLHGITTHWVKLAGLQGFKRIRKIGVLGRIEFPDSFTPDALDVMGSLVMTVAYNYDDADVDTYTFDVQDLQAAGQIDPLHLRVHIARQKCAAIKIGVSYVPNDGGQELLGDNIFCSLTVSGLALEVGIKPGIRKIGHAGGVSVS